MSRQNKIKKNLKYDPIYEYHPSWLKLVWCLSFLFLVIVIGIVLKKFADLTEIIILQIEFFNFVFVILALIIGYFINYYLMFGLYIKFGNNDPNYREKFINKKIKADNKKFIKTLKNVMKDYDKSKKKSNSN